MNVVCHKIWQHFYSPHERLQRHKVIKKYKLDQRVSTFLHCFLMVEVFSSVCIYVFYMYRGRN